MMETSTAAEDETPFPSGTAEDTRMEMPSVKRRPRSCIRTTKAPATYAAQLHKCNDHSSSAVMLIQNFVS